MCYNVSCATANILLSHQNQEYHLVLQQTRYKSLQFVIPNTGAQ